MITILLYVAGFIGDMSVVCNNPIDAGIALTDCVCSPPNTRYNYASADWDALLLDLSGVDWRRCFTNC